MLAMEAFLQQIVSLNSDDAELEIQKITSGNPLVNYYKFTCIKQKLNEISPSYDKLLPASLFLLLPTVEMQKGSKVVYKKDLISAVRQAVDNAIFRYNIDSYCCTPGVIETYKLKEFLENNYA